MSGSIQLGIALALILMIAALTTSFAFRAGRTGAEPIIRASFKQLQTDWYQVGMSVTNRAPYRLAGVSLRRVRPRSARLMAPITSLRTRQGDFQVWSDPATDLATTSIPIDLVVGPHEARHGSISPGSEAHMTAWLFLPEKSEPTQLTLEFVFKDGGGHLRHYRFIATRVR
ncbi:MAG: hypothetical protein JJE37_11545 [Methyloceanibacter sp.]|jgi:hypothetical protein|nr:hypothetical protein [Methyloceanibacter sp.]